MKKQILNLGRALNKVEQKKIKGGTPPPPPGLGGPCDCSVNYTTVPGSSECTYPGSDPLFPHGICLGTVQNGMCC